MNDEKLVYNIIGCLLIIPFLIGVHNLYVSWAYPGDTWFNWEHGRISLRLFTSSIAVVAIVFIWVIFRMRITMLNHQEKYTLQLRNKENECSKKIRDLEKDFQSKLNFQTTINKELEKVLKSKTPLRHVAALVADFETAIYEKDVKYLRYKPRPARHAADIVSAIKNSYYQSLEKYKVIQYEYEFILKLFPEIKTYIDVEESIVQMAQFSSIKEVNDNIDRVRLWINDEEYKQLSVDERNQLALDKYKNRKKTKWEIGIEYELYIGYLLREGKAPFNKRYDVIQFGELNGLQDLGRDIIAETYEYGKGKTIYVIQCKRWSDEKLIHENAICQLFGTTMEYQIKRGSHANWNYVPVFISTTELSDMAKEFARRLNVMVLRIPMGDYPMIKCNINGLQKIYHLPFDQQYHNTQIKNEGEFYAFTVAEAVSKGFRRAMRHFN